MRSFEVSLNKLVNKQDCMWLWCHDAHATFPLRWRHNGRDSVSNHQPHHCLLNRLFRRRSKKTSKLRVTGLCVVNSPHKWPVTRKMFPFDDVIMCNTDQPTCHTCDPSRPSGWLDDVTKIWAFPWESVRPSVLVIFREPLDCRKITNTYMIIRTRPLSKCLVVYDNHSHYIWKIWVEIHCRAIKASNPLTHRGRDKMDAIS